MQTIFGRPNALGFEGQRYGTAPKKSNSKKPTYDIDFGRMLSYDDANKEAVSEVGTNKVVLTADTDIASGTYAFTIKFTKLSDGSETSYSISEAFDSNDATTMGNVVTALEALTEVHTDTSYSSNVLTIIPESGYIMEVSSEAGTGLVITKVNSDTRNRAGFSVWQDKEMFEENGAFVSRYRKDKEIVEEMVKGDMVVQSSTGFNADSTLYVHGYGSNRGRLSNAAGDNGIAVTSGVKHCITANDSNSKGVISIDI